MGGGQSNNNKPEIDEISLPLPHESEWVEVPNPDKWSGIAISGGGQSIIASVYGGPLWLSSNYGATWDAQQWENTRQWIGTTSSCNNSKRAAIVQHGNIWVQEGSDWKEMTASAKDWQAITYSCDGTRLVAIGK